MNFSHSTHRSPEQRAFTLIELLVVITIIAVLAGLLLPVAQKVLENSRKVSAKSTEMQIISAVNTYQTDYGQYPVPAVAAGANSTDITFGLDQKSPNQALFDVLRALNTTPDPVSNVLLNSRRVVYFESKNVRSATNPRDGFIATGTPTGNSNATPPVSLVVGDLVDPWGNMYCVRIDANYTGIVKNPYVSTTPTTTDTDDPANPPLPTDLTVLRTGVISWSYGNDGIIASKNITVVSPYSPTPGDDVDSWQ